ncbi:MAG: methionine--tRNA ligase [Armatimonadetes bacterium]|nr:methionine--tRNA ligase [Armatimonadota bacterium]
MARRYYVTTPIYYVNDVPHLGNCYTTLAADILTRFCRAREEEVLFATGTDEHAPKVALAAAQAGQTPQAFTDQMAARFQAAFRDLNVAYDVFIRTTEPRQTRAVQEVFRTLQERGDIYKGIYEGWYCLSDETYFSEEETVREEGPAGQPLHRCPNEFCRRELQLIREENYFFALSRYGDRLLAHINAHPEFLQPDFRRNEVTRFIQEGLRDVCVTRAASGWGIPVPGDPTQTIYVWFDALINYLTVAGYPDDRDALAKWWPADLHLVGKDIYVRFHCTLWPAMLMGVGLPLPSQIFGHGFWMSEGQKMSKSLGNVIHPVALAQWLADLSGAEREVAVDALRYYLFREVPFGVDGDFSRASLLQRFNSDLANDLGNALNRSLSLAVQNFEGKVPLRQAAGSELAIRAAEMHARVEAALERLDLQQALMAIWEYVGAINKFLDDRAPWSLARAGRRAELAGVLYEALEATRVVSVWVAPFMPAAAAAMRTQLGLTEPPRWPDAAAWGQLAPDAPLGTPRPIFPRIERKVMAQALWPSPAPSAPPVEKAPPAPAAPTGRSVGTAEQAVPETINIDEFARLELRVAEILSAARVPSADKLLQLRVSLGEEERTVLAGIAEWYAPEDLVGRKVVLLANLAPRKIRGIASQGMLLAAEANGTVSLLQPDQDLPAGARVR